MVLNSFSTATEAIRGQDLSGNIIFILEFLLGYTLTVFILKAIVVRYQVFYAYLL